MASVKYTKEVLAQAAAAAVSVAGVLRILGVKPSGGFHHYISRLLKAHEIDTSHFTGQAHNRGMASPRRRPPDEILIASKPGSGRTKPRHLRRAMLHIGIPEICEKCGIGTTWLGRPLTLQIDHINGDFLDNRPQNVRFLCPNCHSQTPTFCNRDRSDVEPDDVVYDPGARTPTGAPLGRKLPDQRQPAWQSWLWQEGVVAQRQEAQDLGS